MAKTTLRFVLTFALMSLACFWSMRAFAFEDPTKGEPFFPWLWEDQFVPTFKAAGETGSLVILGSGVGATVISERYDDEVREANQNNQRLSEDFAGIGSKLGSGAPGILIATAQLFFDQPNGLAHGRALALTSASHISIALIAQRTRPNGDRTLSFPSGHGSSAFATATSLAYSYGWWVGVPSFAAAYLVSAARVADDAHWLSDVVAGAALGIFWGRASAISDKYRDSSKKETSNFRFVPSTIPGGAIVVLRWEN
ncbi:MAG TPA: phosphatase PAP2 family protein [Bdellovibrionales bacterium]|nr:phosphatase PAP2 family protein [Bdellovibrionales bacterium]